jgi:chromosome segregation protein
MDEEDLLECGIEIVARPPGKRLQNLMLLSGGEKALTAIALLFALFRIKPSPFCILDEVDAPLDDVNTLRFVAMLRELAKETQCIVITHNKLTMEVAATLYGVTMEERGVSKLIEVELEEVQPERATA